MLHSGRRDETNAEMQKKYGSSVRARMKEDSVDADGKMRDCTSDDFFFYKVRGKVIQQE